MITKILRVWSEWRREWKSEWRREWECKEEGEI